MAKKGFGPSAKNKRVSGPFTALPHEVLKSGAYIALSFSAKALLNEFLLLYRGTNNGDLSIHWAHMKERGWSSQTTLLKARDELERGGFVMQTRMGGRNLATLYGLTFFELDERPWLEVTRRTWPFPNGSYKLSIPLPPLKPARPAARSEEKNPAPVSGVTLGALRQKLEQPPPQLLQKVEQCSHF